MAPDLIKKNKKRTSAMLYYNIVYIYVSITYGQPQFAIVTARVFFVAD